MFIEQFNISGAYLHEVTKTFMFGNRNASTEYIITNLQHGQLEGNVSETPTTANICSIMPHEHLKRHVYNELQSDTSVFIKNSADQTTIVGISVEDFLPIAEDKSLIE